MNRQKIFLGTELKLNIHIDPVGELTMDDYEFTVEVYCSAKKVISVSKNDAIRNDDSNYVILIDTANLGVGDLKCKVYAYIPDYDFDDFIRTEVVGIDTGITITKTI